MLLVFQEKITLVVLIKGFMRSHVVRAFLLLFYFTFEYIFIFAIHIVHLPTNIGLMSRLIVVSVLLMFIYKR